MSIKILQLDLVLVSIFKEFVEFLHSSAIVKIAVTNENLVETNISKITFRFDLKMSIIFFGFCNLTLFLTRNLTHYPKYQIYTFN